MSEHKMVESQIIRITNALQSVQGGKKSKPASQKDFKKWFHKKCGEVLDTKSKGAIQVKDSRKLNSFLSELESMRSLFNDSSSCNDMDTILSYVQNITNPDLVATRKGISSLPDSFLAAAFKALSDHAKDVLHVSAVCKRFRKVALKTPDMWSTIQYTDKPKIWKLFLTRSKTADLTIHMRKFYRYDKDKDHTEDEDGGSSDDGWEWVSDEFFKCVSKESHRWRELKLELKQLPENRAQRGLDMHKVDLSLPKLVTLHIDDDNINTGSDCAESFVKKCHMPALRYYHGFILPGLEEYYAPRLISCEFVIDNDSAMFAPAFFYMLKACKDLQLILPSQYDRERWISGQDMARICLDLRIKDDRMWSTPSSPKGFWTKLQTLSLAFSSLCLRDPTIIRFFLKWVPVDQIHELTLILNAASVTGGARSLLGFYETITTEFKELKTLVLGFLCTRAPQIPFTEVKMNALEHLVIECHDGKEPTEKFSKLHKQKALPKFKTVKFVFCHNLSSPYLLDIAEVCSRKAYSATFEKLILTACRLCTSTVDELMDVLQDKLQFTDADD